MWKYHNCRCNYVIPQNSYRFLIAPHLKMRNGFFLSRSFSVCARQKINALFVTQIFPLEAYLCELYALLCGEDSWIWKRIFHFHSNCTRPHFNLLFSWTNTWAYLMTATSFACCAIVNKGRNMYALDTWELNIRDLNRKMGQMRCATHMWFSMILSFFSKFLNHPNRTTNVYNEMYVSIYTYISYLFHCV